AVLDGPSQDIGNSFDASVRMPGESRQVVGGYVISEIVEQKERIEVLCVSEAKGASQVNACAFHCGLRFDYSSDRSNGHLHLQTEHPASEVSGQDPGER